MIEDLCCGRRRHLMVGTTKFTQDFLDLILQKQTKRNATQNQQRQPTVMLLLYASSSSSHLLIIFDYLSKTHLRFTSTPHQFRVAVHP